ncbi:hypothetical protein BH24CHL9_BH24CHL9_12820 [soil metagenome]
MTDHTTDESPEAPRERGVTSGLTLGRLVADRVLDAELTALLWLLVEGGVPVVVAGDADPGAREAVAAAILSLVPGREAILLHADDAGPTLEHLTGLLRGGFGLGLTVGARDLRGVFAMLEAGPGGLPADAVRRLGVVLIVDATDAGLRTAAAHYLRPTERDAEGHVQRRPPAVLATWDRGEDRYEHFAWGITPELGDRVNRAQADREERQRDRAAFLTRVAADGAIDPERYAGRLGA